MIKHISITNMAKFEEFEADTPNICLLQGANGKGKSSFINCIQYVAAQGHDPEMLRAGSEVGEVILTLQDDSQIRVRTTTKDTSRFWKPAGGKKWVPGRELIDAVCNALAYNPLSFLELDDKKQVEKLLQIMPIPFDPAEIQEAVGEAELEASTANVTDGMNGLEIVGAIENAITAARRVLNVASDTQTKHAAELESALPPAAPEGTDWRKESLRLQNEKERLGTERTRAAGTAQAEYQILVDAAKSACTVDGEAVDRDVNKRIADLERERLDRKTKLIVVRDAAIHEARNAFDACCKTADEKILPVIEQITIQHSQAIERDRANQQATGTRRAIEVARNEARVKKSRSEILSASLDRLTKLKATIAGRLPIPGIVIQDGKIWRDESGKLVPFSRWNQSDQDLFCVKLGILAYGERAGVLCLDGFEKFDSARRTGFLKTCEKYAAAKGIQFVIASVSDGPLEVVKA